MPPKGSIFLMAFLFSVLFLSHHCHFRKQRGLPCWEDLF